MARPLDPALVLAELLKVEIEMASVLRQIVIDCRDPDRVARFWEQALGRWTHVGRDCLWMHVSDDPSPAGMLLVFVKVPDHKVTKNRVHVDVSPDVCDQDDEVRRLIGLGARPVDIGQREKPWVVLADPEGNELCVLPRRATDQPDGVPAPTEKRE